MHKTLNKPPLTYVLAQVKISSIQKIGDYVPELQEVIRQDFPIFNQISIQAIEIKPNFPPTSTAITQWHFKDKEGTTGILLDSGSIAIHTSNYDSYGDLIKRFEQVLSKFGEKLNISLFERLGLRYINIIKSDLDEFIESELLGFQLKDEKCVKENKFLSKTETTQQSSEGYIKTQATHIGSKEIASSLKNYLVPPDLMQTAEMLTFKHHKEPENRFLILDIDHFNEQQGDFNVTKIIEKFSKLHEVISKVFSKAVTRKAMAEWSK